MDVASLYYSNRGKEFDLPTKHRTTIELALLEVLCSLSSSHQHGQIMVHTHKQHNTLTYINIFLYATGFHFPGPSHEGVKLSPTLIPYWEMGEGE